MIYRALGLMSGSSLDGLDIAYVEFLENGGKWSYEILHADCYTYPADWINKLKNAVFLHALDYQLLHCEYGHYLGGMVNRFIEAHQLQYKVAVIASHGHTTFHLPQKKMTAQLGDGAAIAAVTQLPVVSDLRAMDVAFGGQGAPIVPVGEKLLFGSYQYFLNLGGIANISCNAEKYSAFDICAANRILNMLANEDGKEYDAGGQMAASGTVINELLDELNALEYYIKPYPKSLDNSFGVDVVYPLIKKYTAPVEHLLHTYTIHIAQQIKNAVVTLNNQNVSGEMLVTGGSAFNDFLIAQIQLQLNEVGVTIIKPDEKLIKYKEALIMALLGVLRWREEYTVLSSVTGAARDSVGGAMWMGQEE